MTASCLPAPLRALCVPVLLATLVAGPAAAQAFDEDVVDVGNVGLTVTNAGFIGNAGIRNNPQTDPPSFEYPLDSGVEHLFEAGLWVGARRADGVVTVRTGAVTSSSGYRPGATGFELVPATPLQARSTLPESDAFTPLAVSQQDFVGRFTDDTRLLNPPPQDSDALLGLTAEFRSYAWSFPFTEEFVIVEVELTNTSEQAWDSVYVGWWHDLVVHNVLTTTEAGGDFFNDNGVGFLGYPEYEAGSGDLLEAAPDSQFVTYAFNAGGDEESLNTYGAIAFLGAEWTDPATGDERFFHPFLADAYRADGYAAPRANPRWWLFGGGNDQLARPANDAERYERMGTPFPNPVLRATQGEYEEDLADFFERLRTDGLNEEGNWIGVFPVGPVPRVEPGTSLTATFAFVAALKPERFQDLPGRRIDTEETRALLRENVGWAMRTYAGEDQDYDGELDPGEDVNGNGRLDRYLIPEPPRAPRVRAEAGPGTVELFWDRTAERSRDPITGRRDFEGYRVYRSAPGDDRLGDPRGRATLVAQYDSVVVRDVIVSDVPAGNDTTVVLRNSAGYNVGFCDVRVPPEGADGSVEVRVPPCAACFPGGAGSDACRDPEGATVTDRLYYRTFPGDTTRYFYRYADDDLLSGWQYAYAVTAIDEGDPELGLPVFESGRNVNALRVFPGARAAGEAGARPAVGVYPNPYRVRAAWDGTGAQAGQTRKLYFTGLPARAEIRVYTLSGDVVAELDHAAGSAGDAGWYDQFSSGDRVLAGGERAWDILSESELQVATGLYFFSVRDLDSGEVQTGKFVVIK